jgi:hypothetical protein
MMHISEATQQAQQSSDSDDLISSRSSSDPIQQTTARLTAAVTPLKQKDAQWADEIVGNADDAAFTIGAQGSLLTCMTMLANATRRVTLTPAQLNDIKKQQGAFYPRGAFGGLMTHFALNDETDQSLRLVHVSSRLTAETADYAREVSKLLTHVAQAQPAILQIESAAPSNEHFVLVTDAQDERLCIFDPHDGAQSWRALHDVRIQRALLYFIAPQIKLGAPQKPKTRDVAPMLGLHVHADEGQANAAFEAGCRLFCVTNHFALANQLAERGALVIAQQRWANWTPTLHQLMNAIGDPHDGVIYALVNDGMRDVYSPDAIRTRAEFDVAAAHLIRKQTVGRARYLAGGYALSQLNFDDVRVCRALSEGYAAAYNERVLMFDVPLLIAPLSDADMAELRLWEMLFERCGFDPRVRGVLSSVTPVASACTRESGSLTALCQRWVEIQSRPFAIHKDTDAAPAHAYEGEWESPLAGMALSFAQPRDMALVQGYWSKFVQINS